MLFDIGVWPPLRPTEMRQFEQGLAGIYQSLAVAIWGDEAIGWRADRIRAKLQLLSEAGILLRVARLRHLQNLCLRADSYVWAFLHLDQSWLRMIHDDLKWLQLEILKQKRIGLLGDKPWNMEGDGRIMSKLHRVTMTYRLRNAVTGMNGTVKCSTYTELWRDSRRTEHTEMNACMRCQKIFKSDQAWSVLAFRVHGRPAPARRFAGGTTCPLFETLFAT